MDFHFVIPCTNSDLLNSEGDNYYVKQVYDTRELPDLLKACKQAALSGNPFYIFDHFDTCFSIIEHAKNMPILNVVRAYDLLFLTTDKLGTALANFLTGTEDTGNGRTSHLNLLKMTLFLMSGTVKAIDQIYHQAQVDSGNLKKNKKSQLEGFESFDWEAKRFKFLLQIYNILQLPLEKLWIPPVAEENFVNMVCDTAYRTLEIYNLRERHVSDTIFQILGTAIKRYNHALTFPVRVMQILQSCENALAPAANGILLLYEEFGINTIFSVLINEIIETLRADAADNQISRNFSNFLIELSSVAPKVMIPHISTLAEELLNLESYTLRNSVLQIMGDIIICELTAENLSEELKETRNEFLEDLLTHINDVSAHVRSKVLQIWSHLKEENAVPLAFQHKVLKGAVERLEDRTATVRKNATILIKSFLERNPFAAKLTLAELEKRYEEESEKLEKLRNEMAEQSKKVAKLDKEWDTVVPELLPFVEESVQQSTQEHMNTAENYEDLVKRISTLLTKKEYKKAAALVKQADYAAGNTELRMTLSMEEQSIYFMALLKSYLYLSNGCKLTNEEFVTQENTVKFLEDSIEFSKIITKAVPKLQEMLMSKTNSDVFEAVDFFTTAFLFGIKGTESGMRRMLYLVWSGDKEKRDAVLNAYKRVLFTTDQQGRAHSMKVVKNLCALFDDLTYGHYSAMEFIIKEWVENGDIDPQILQVLFERFTMKLEDTSENESRQALQLLIMTSAAKSSITTANLNIIESICFSERSLKDPRLYTGCLAFILNSVPANLKSKFYKRYEENNNLVQKTLRFYEKFFFHPSVKDFDEISTKTVEFFYQLCQAPDIICQKLLQNLHTKMKKFMEKIQYIQETLQPSQSQPSQTQQSQIDVNRTRLQLPAFLVSRYVHLIGLIVMKEMIFLDIDVYNNMKYREDLKEQKKNLNKKKGKKKNVNLDMSASESLKRLSGTAAEPQQEPDEELVGATAEDSIAELINHICEDVLIYSQEGFLHKLIPIVIRICKYPGKYKDEVLQQAASLALIRFMSVSSKFCEEQMPFLMNILHQTKNIKIKCNIIIGLSDLTFRFPNVLEPWTSHFYSTLHESNDELRLTAVKMLSHLILHEMIRVKGQISDLAMCIVDTNDEIKNMTQQFFKEIAHKSNILYNVLPDIISRLSDVNLNLEEEKYHVIMRYILGLIQKDRQVESLVEKLCLRFCVTRNERQWRDIAFCLSLLNYTEKTIKKLTDNIQHFKDKVQVEEVHQSFKTIIANSSKLAKPEMKTAITEFENRLAECFDVRDNDSQTDSIAEQPPSKAKKPLPKKKGRRKVSSSSESESSSEDEDVRRRRNRMGNKGNSKKKNSEPSTSHSTRTSNRHVQKAQVVMETSTSEEDVPKSKRGRNKR